MCWAAMMTSPARRRSPRSSVRCRASVRPAPLRSWRAPGSPLGGASVVSVSPGSELTARRAPDRAREEIEMTRRDIEFNAEGVTLRGWFYPAEGAGRSAPAVVMAHGFSAVKEMYLDSFAEVFAAAGLSALVYDNRNFGASGGGPPQGDESPPPAGASPPAASLAPHQPRHHPPPDRACRPPLPPP